MCQSEDGGGPERIQLVKHGKPRAALASFVAPAPPPWPGSPPPSVAPPLSRGGREEALGSGCWSSSPPVALTSSPWPRRNRPRSGSDMFCRVRNRGHLLCDPQHPVLGREVILPVLETRQGCVGLAKLRCFLESFLI